MANCQAQNKSVISSTLIIFFVSFLLTLLVLFGSSKSPHFFLFPSPSLFRDHFSLPRPSSSSSSSFPSLSPLPSLSVSVSAPTLHSVESPPSKHYIDTEFENGEIPVGGNPESNGANEESSAVRSLELSGNKSGGGSVAGSRVSDNVEIPISEDSKSLSDANGMSFTAQNLELNETHGEGFKNARISEFKEGKVEKNGGEKSIVEKLENVGLGEKSSCNLYVGKWVKDEDYPLYRPGFCPYVDEAFDCQSNGRPDDDYMKWRWKPDGCDLPRFNTSDFLLRIRGKKLMLVGDSVNRNQFESMLCLLQAGLPDKSKMYETRGYRITKGRGYYIFKFVDYNCTVEFVRSHFLVREGVHTLSLDRIDKTSPRWKQADILIFNTGHWWTHGKTARGRNYYKEGDLIYPRFDAVEAYRRALTTWGNWIDKNLNPKKHLVFYRAYSSAHFRGGEWDSGGSCNGETEPVSKGAILDSYPLKMKIVEEVIQQMKTPVVLLNITKLTNFRKDGHPSIYCKNITAGIRVSRRRQDCSHWCLPGVPDAWNELIYATLVYQQIPTTCLQ